MHSAPSIDRCTEVSRSDRSPGYNLQSVTLRPPWHSDPPVPHQPDESQSESRRLNPSESRQTDHSVITPDVVVQVMTLTPKGVIQAYQSACVAPAAAAQNPAAPRSLARRTSASAKERFVRIHMIFRIWENFVLSEWMMFQEPRPSSTYCSTVVSSLDRRTDE